MLGEQRKHLSHHTLAVDGEDGAAAGRSRDGPVYENAEGREGSSKKRKVGGKGGMRF